MRGHDQWGFTLLELLVVLVIAVMATTLVAPGFSQVTERMALRGDSQKVAALLRFARSESIVQGSKVSIELQPETGTLLIYSQKPTSVYPVESGVDISLTGNRNESVLSNRILFFPDGSSSGGGIHLRSPAGHYQIVVDWLTGRVKVDG